jgi:hypothetical protein
VLLGIFMFIVPIAGALVLAFWFGIYELAFGVSMLMLAVPFVAGHRRAARSSRSRVMPEGSPGDRKPPGPHRAHRRR